MMKLIVGLGNPGERFQGTRHNLGIEAVRAWVAQAETQGWQGTDWGEYNSYPAEVVQLTRGQDRLWALFPLTYMNESGVAVAAFCRDKNIEPNEIVLVQDELQLDLGDVAWKESGSAAGHNGVRSVQQQLGSQEMRRLRLGIGRPLDEVPVEKFVLQKFLTEELPLVEQMKTKAIEELNVTLHPPAGGANFKYLNDKV